MKVKFNKSYAKLKFQYIITEKMMSKVVLKFYYKLRQHTHTIYQLKKTLNFNLPVLFFNLFQIYKRKQNYLLRIQCISQIARALTESNVCKGVFT